MAEDIPGTAAWIPDGDTFQRVFERTNPKVLSECLYDWLASRREDGSVIAIDGKTNNLWEQKRKP